MKTILFLLSFTIFSISAHATIWTVDSTNNAGYGSLRAAVDSSSNGDTIRFNPNLIASGSDSIVLSTSISFSKSLTFKGLFTTSDTLFISGGGNDRIFTISNASKVIIDSLVLVNGNAIKGGAIKLSYSDSLLILNSVIKDNVASSRGGGVCLDAITTLYATTSRLIFFNTKIIDNSAGAGGGVFTYTRVEFENCLISGNTGVTGGGVHGNGANILIKKITINNSQIIGNSANKGGGIYCTFSNTPLFTPIEINNSTLIGNIATSKGGGIFFENFYGTDTTEIHINNSTISDNTAGDYGGGVYSKSVTSTLIVDSSTINGNSAASGGGIFSDSYGSSSSYVFSSIITITNSTLNGNSGNYGGAVYSKGSEYSIIDIDNSTFNNNMAINNGGAIYSSRAGSYSFLGPFYTTTYNVSNSSFVGNSGAKGGGFYGNDGRHIEVNVINSIFTGNSGTNGGAAFCTENPNISTIKVENSLFNGNLSGEGAIYNRGDSLNITVDNCSFIGNHASDNGGAIYTSSDILNVKIDSSIINSNTAGLDGGGVYLRGSGNFVTEIRNSNFDSNFASNNGGAIYLYPIGTQSFCDITIDSSVINANGATGSGGGICIEPAYNTSSLTVTNSTISNNNATMGGGVLSGFIGNTGYPYGPTSLSFSNSNVMNNSAQNGGGIYCTGVTLTELNISNSEISFNNASINGAGVFILVKGPGTSQMFINNSTVSNNTAIGNGGGLYTSSSSGFCFTQIEYSTFGENSSSLGGAVYSDSHTSWPSTTSYTTSEISVLNSTISSNTSGLYSKTATGANAISTINLGGSIVALNDTNNIINSHSPTVVSGGYNVISDSTLLGSVGTDQLNIDSLTLNLDALFFNGGTTRTMMPISPSVAINSGDPVDTTNAQNIPIVGVREVGAAEVCFGTFSTDIIVSCNPITWMDGITYTSSNNMATHTMVNAAGCDSIISLNLTVNGNTMVDTIVACDSYIWINGITYTSTNNTASDTFTNVLGCDSIIWLNLTINYTDIVTDTLFACDSLTWIDGITYFSSNTTAVDTFVNVNGCDSIITLNLTIGNSTYGIDTLIACDSLTWIDGITYYSSNNSVTDTLVNFEGCDSIVTLNLTINANTGIDMLTACDSLTWINGITYTSSNNTVIDTLVNMAGCDSIVTLNLTINNTTFAIDTLIACDNLTWIDGVTYTTSNNTAVHTLVNTAGCDSVVTLNLTINYSSHPIDTVFACESYTWINGVTYTASNNTATVTLSTVNGCDSIIGLNLTISSLNSSYTWLDNGSANYYFTNTSTGNFTNSHWAFGDGSTSSSFNSSHHFWANGLYVVVLAIYDSNLVGDSCISYFTDTIIVTGATNSTSCNAGWVVFADSSSGGVTIVNSSTGSNLSYHWDFGDGDTSNLSHPSHTYNSNGPFNLCLTINDTNGCSDTYCDSISSNGVLFKNGFDINVVANYPLGIQNLAQKPEVKIYPNPTSSTLNIETQNFKITKIQILDYSGKVVKTITSNFDVVNVENLATGVYYLELFGENESITRKFIKQ